MGGTDTGHRWVAASAGPWWRKYLLTGRSAVAYTGAAAIMIVAVAARAVLELAVPGFPLFMILFPAVMLAGLFCGTEAGATGALLGAAMADYLWLPPRLSFGPLSPHASLQVLVYLSTSALILWMTDSLRRALLEAESARNMLDIALAHGDVGAWEADGDARLVRASASAHALFGLPYDGKPRPLEDWLARLAPKDAAPVRRALRDAAAGRGSVHAQYSLKQHDGSIRWIESRGGALRAGGMSRVLGVMIDVTKRVVAERALQAKDDRLRASEARYRALTGAIPGLLFVADADGRNVFVNTYFEEFAGMPAEDLCGDGWARLVHEDDIAGVRQTWARAVASGQQYEAEYRLRGGDGQYRWFLCRGLPVHDAAESLAGWFGVAMDIEDRKRAESALANSEQQLKQALEARELLMREADHRIKNSLQLVISLLHLQRRRLVDPEAAEAIGSAIARVEAVAHSHLALQQSKDFRVVDLGAALRELCGNLGQLNPAVQIRCGFEQSLALDAERAIPLALIVSELLSNALRHAYPYGDGIATVDAMTSGDVLMVTVSDHGSGHLAEVTERGLGWTVVHSLARKIGADLEVRSASGEGTTCTLRLRGWGDGAAARDAGAFGGVERPPSPSTDMPASGAESMQSRFGT